MELSEDVVFPLVASLILPLFFPCSARIKHKAWTCRQVLYH